VNLKGILSTRSECCASSSTYIGYVVQIWLNFRQDLTRCPKTWQDVRKIDEMSEKLDIEKYIRFLEASIKNIGYLFDFNFLREQHTTLLLSLRIIDITTFE
jgi:hypothetical protein